MSRTSVRVLVADDDPTVALLVQAALAAPDFAVAAVDNGAAAWDEFRRSPFDIVLLDVEMPDMDGFAVCSAIRESLGNSFPVVLVTGRCDASFIERALALQAEYLAKPIDWSALARHLEEILFGASGKFTD